MERNLLMDIIVDGIVGEVIKAYKSEMYRGSVILLYSAIDSMAFLNMPVGQTDVTRQDFINWVDSYLQTNNGTKYPALDLYAARCAMLHTYGTQSAISRQGHAKQIFYKLTSDGGHIIDEKHGMYGLELNDFINDFNRAVLNFLSDLESNENLRNRVSERLPMMMGISFYPKKQD